MEILHNTAQPNSGEITRWLHVWNQGNADGLNHLFTKIFQELKALARRHFSGESNDRITIQPTALVHELYLRLLQNERYAFQNRSHFFWYAGKLMRLLLVEQARSRQAKKRSHRPQAAIEPDALPELGSQGLDPETLLSLDYALEQLKALDPRQAQIVEMRYFAGLRTQEIATLMGVSKRTVERDWLTAKYWLSGHLKAAGDCFQQTGS